jgi:hypothetical protein
MTRPNRAMSDAGGHQPPQLRQHVAARLNNNNNNNSIANGNYNDDNDNDVDVLPRATTTIGTAAMASGLARARLINKPGRSLSDAGRRPRVPPLQLPTNNSSNNNNNNNNNNNSNSVDNSNNNDHTALTNSEPTPVGQRSSPFVRRRQPGGGSMIKQGATRLGAIVDTAKASPSSSPPNASMRASTVLSILKVCCCLFESSIF